MKPKSYRIWGSLNRHYIILINLHYYCYHFIILFKIRCHCSARVPTWAQRNPTRQMTGFDYPVLKCFSSRSFFISMYEALGSITAFETKFVSVNSPCSLFTLALPFKSLKYYIIKYCVFKGIIHFKYLKYMTFQIFLLEIL